MNQKDAKGDAESKKRPGRPRNPIPPTEPPGWFARRFTAQNEESGKGRFERLFESIREVNKVANRDVLFPRLANHLITAHERRLARQHLDGGGGNLGKMDGASLLYWCLNGKYTKYTANSSPSPQGSHEEQLKQKQRAYRKELEQEGIFTILPSELALLPGAAASASFSQNFNMLEQFAIVRFKLQPIFLGLDSSLEHSLDNSDGMNPYTITARSLDGKLIPEKLSISQHITAAVDYLMKRSNEHATSVTAYKQGNWKEMEISPPARLLGATTWECWEKNTLVEAIHRLEQECASRSGINPTIQRQEEAKRLRDTSLGSMAHLRSCMSQEGRVEEINYYRWLLTELEISGLEMVLVPVLEAICFACSHEALNVFYSLLTRALCGGNTIKPTIAQEMMIQPSTHSASQHSTGARAWMVSGESLARIWGLTLNLSALRFLDTSTMTSQQGLQIFIKAIEIQENLLSKELKQTLLGFWHGAVRGRSFPEGLMEMLVSWREGVDNCLDGKEDWSIKEGIPELNLQLERLGITTPPRWEEPTPLLIEKLGPALGQYLPVESPAITSDLNNLAQNTLPGISTSRDSSKMLLDNGASNLIKMIKELETFWIDEQGLVAPLLSCQDPHPERRINADGRWIKKFKRYVVQVSAELVRNALKEFAKQVVEFRQVSSSGQTDQ